MKEIISVTCATGYPAGIYLLKINNGSARTMCEIYSKLANTANINAVVIVNLKQISHVFLHCERSTSRRQLDGL